MQLQSAASRSASAIIHPGDPTCHARVQAITASSMEHRNIAAAFSARAPRTYTHSNCSRQATYMRPCAFIIQYMPMVPPTQLPCPPRTAALAGCSSCKSYISNAQRLVTTLPKRSLPMTAGSRHTARAAL
eukprot:1158754-Pelagomonas_calceolata.AAC.5